MKFKFESNQPFQLTAIESVVKLFEGQRYLGSELGFELGTELAAVPNCLEVDSDVLLQNLQKVQSENGLPVDDELDYIGENVESLGEKKTVRFLNFSVEMETGTGKTYVYLRTVLELFRRYGLRKFVVVVPSVAVREGVIKTLEVTQVHLRQLYDNPPYRYYVYDSAKLSQIRQFALSDSVEIMVMTIDSFNKASNVIHQTTDRLQGETPVHLVQATSPILILDEPQNMASELSVKALAALNPIFALRYSATHRNPFNVVYRLTPYDAYKQGLVKRIEVAGVEQADDVNRAYLKVDDIQNKKNTFTARFSVHKMMKNGRVKEQRITAKLGDNLADKTNRPEYGDYIVDEISLTSDYVRFANGVEMYKGESTGEDKEALFEAQIRYTIEEHFRKQERLKPKNIKVLSLFFIDRVDNYVNEEGIVRSLFRKCFDELKTQYSGWDDVDVDSVQAAYFAQRRTKSGEIIFEDSKTGESKKDVKAYDLIMKHKERLLSFDEPTCFIFSHSALREGWDSPNVFQICTLNQTVSEMKKRQEIGRGVRLAVNQKGNRIHDEKINVLTVIANESYTNYVERLQIETHEEYGGGGLPPVPPNARKRGIARLRKEYTLKPEFKELWERIKHKTRYAVNINTKKLIREVVAVLDESEIRSPSVTITKAEVEIDDDHVFSAMQMSGAKTAINLAGRYPLPNLIDVMMHMLEHTTPSMRLTRKTLLSIFLRTRNQQAALDNPHEFASVTVRIIKEKLTDQLIDGVRYEKIGECYEMCQFEARIDSWTDYLTPAERSIYDFVVFDSEIERKFVEGLERRDDVKLYLKLPAFFKVTTPIGAYNPDWAIVLEPRDAFGRPTGEQMLYLVRETKSAESFDDLRPDEARKIRCGVRHFKETLGVDYKYVTSARDLD